VPGVSQLIVPVKIATPDAEGKVFHEVQPGQSFWAIAIAYKITIKDIETWNNLSRESKLQVGQRLFIPGENTEGYATPTPVGMIRSAPLIRMANHPHRTGLPDAQQILGRTKLDRYHPGDERPPGEWPPLIGQKLYRPGACHPARPPPATPVEKPTPSDQVLSPSTAARPCHGSPGITISLST
jgi:LysM repeat protein